MVLLFVLLWVVVAFAVFFVALRGGPHGARETLQSQGRAARRVTLGLITVAYLVFGVALPTYVIANVRDDHADQGPGGEQLTAVQTKGREIFGQYCVQCHVLRASHSVGRVGPNLDKLRPNAALVLDAVKNGRARGIGRMPQGLALGKDAKNVAAYVAAVAGR